MLLTNSTAAPITITYVVTPSVGTCLGTPVDIDIVVDPFPAPVLVTPQSKAICSGDNVAYEILLNPANQPAGTLFNWPDPDGAGPATAGTNVVMGVAGTTHINDILVNITNAPIAVNLRCNSSQCIRLLRYNTPRDHYSKPFTSVGDFSIENNL